MKTERSEKSERGEKIMLFLRSFKDFYALNERHGKNKPMERKKNPDGIKKRKRKETTVVRD